MELEKLYKLDAEKKEKILCDLINNDLTYWKKIFILLAMMDEKEDTELLDLIVEHKIEEIKLANKKYNFNIKNNEISEIVDKKSYMSVMEKILEGSEDKNYEQACTQVLEILKFVPQKYYDYISKKFIERLKNNANIEYKLNITEETKFEDLDISNETKEILALISDKFWTENGQTTIINKIFNKKEM